MNEESYYEINSGSKNDEKDAVSYYKKIWFICLNES